MSALTEHSVTEFVALTASDAPAPGGGSVSALAGALAAALVSMVASLTGGEKFADVARQMQEIAAKAQAISQRLEAAVQRDTDSFNEYMAALRLPKSSEAEAAARRAAMQAGLQHAALVPLETAETACEIFPLAAQAVAHGNPNAQSDGLVAAMLARTAVLGAVLNVRINLGGIRSESFRSEAAARADACVRRAAEGEAAILRLSKLSADIPPAE